MKQKAYLVGAVVILIIAAVVFWPRMKGRGPVVVSDFTLTASTADANGINAESRFILTSSAPLGVGTIEDNLKIVPETDFEVKKVDSGNTFEIIPTVPLNTNEIYTLAIAGGELSNRDYSWAYQVKAPFAITSSLPRHQANNVPLNTGIEIEFNRENINDPAKHIEITPKTDGDFDFSGNKVRFIPRLTLKPQTIYTITVKPELGTEGSSEKLGEEKIIRFETTQAGGNARGPYIHFYPSFAEFKPDSPIEFNVSSNVSEAVAAVYRFDSANQFLELLSQAKKQDPWAFYHRYTDLDAIASQKTFSATLPIIKTNEGYNSFVRLPNSLAVGYYAIALTANDNTDMAWFQVSPVASLAAVGNGQSLIWLKNAATENSLANVPIRVRGKEVARTGADGVAIFTTPPEILKDENFFLAEAPGGSVVIPVENDYGYRPDFNEQDTWWDYISLNKTIYLPSDIIRFWAIAKPRADSATGEEITATLSNVYWSDNEKNKTIYATKNFKLSDYHTLTGEIAYENLSPGFYYLTLRRGEEIIAQEGLSISEYIKPAYQLTLSPEKPAIFAGETATFKVKGEFFDGTPVTNLGLTYSGYLINKQRNGIITLDGRGEGTITIPTAYTGEERYWPNHFNLSVRPTQAEAGEINTSATIFIFGPHIHQTITQKKVGGQTNFELKNNIITLGNITSGTPSWDTTKYLGAPVPNLETVVTVTEVIQHKNQTGTRYNPISKTTEPIYKYSKEEKFLETRTVTSNASGIAQFSLSPEEKKTYSLTFTTNDEFGRQLKTDRYIYGESPRLEGNEDYSYQIRPLEEKKNGYQLGELVNLNIRNSNDETLLPGSNKFIFITVANNNELTYKIQDSPAYQVTFQNKFIPNANLWAGWFSGGRFHNSYRENLSFNAETRRLNVAVTPNQASFMPGQNIELDIRVTDAAGAPTKAEVNLSAIDEAVFSLRPNEEDITQSLYRDVFQSLTLRSSHRPPRDDGRGGGGAEMGGGEGLSPRSDIQETAIFRSIVTNGSGHAKVNFKLPENITSWRLTSQAVTQDLFAGKTVSFIPVSLPFFVDTTLNNTYLAGDELTLRLRTFGSGVISDSTKYSAESPTLPFKKIEQIGGAIIDLALGKLTVGDHKITARAQNGNSTDGLVSPLHVVESYFNKNTADFYQGTAGLTIEPKTSGYTTLTFSEAGRGTLYRDLKHLTLDRGPRLDQVGATFAAKELLKKYFAEEQPYELFPSERYQSYSGGLQLLPYSGDELEISSLGAHLFNDQTINRVALRKYLHDNLVNKQADRSRSVRALFGLSAFREPILPKLQTLAKDTSLAITEKIFVGLALETLGAKEDARQYYRTAILPEITQQASYAYVRNLPPDETITATALAAALAAGLEEKEAAALALYGKTNNPREILNSFPELIYLSRALAHTEAAETKFSYQLGNKTENKTLSNNETLVLNLSAEELKSFKLNEVKGNLGLTTQYEMPSSPKDVVKDSNLTLTRSYSVNGVPTTEFKDGDLVTVYLTPSFGPQSLDGAYKLTDYLPSGLRAVSPEASRSFGGKDILMHYPIKIENQEVAFVVSKNPPRSISYTARVVSKGRYQAEPAILQSLKSLASMTISQNATVTIR